MGAILSALGGLVASLIGNWVWRAVSALGIGFVTYQGVDLLFSASESKIFEGLGSLGPTVGSFFGILRIGMCIKVWTTAFAMRATLSGVSGGSVTKVKMK